MRAGKDLITESGVELCPKEHTKSATISACSFFFLMGVWTPQKTVFHKYLAEIAFLWKNTRVKSYFSENFLSNDLFNI